MKGLRFIKGAMVTLACWGFIIPQPQVLAASPANTSKDSEPAKAVKPIDVAMRDGGTLAGRVINAEGKGLEGAMVSIRYQGKEVAKTVTNTDGKFAVRSLRGGNHVVVAGQGAAVYRFWAPNTAPPSAQAEAVLVSCPEAVRAQCGTCGPCGGLDIITLATLGLGIAGVTLGAIAVDKINDVEDAVEELQAQSP